MAHLRHQALSLTAVFVALAVGLAAGAGIVGGRLEGQEAVVARLEGQFAALRLQLDEAVQSARRTRASLALYQRALEGALPAVGSARLAGVDVAVEVFPGARDAAAAVTRLLQASGARVRAFPPAAGSRVAPAVLLHTPCGTFAGLVGPPSRGGALPPGMEAFSPPPQAWVWEVESPLGRLSLLVALLEGRAGYVSAQSAVARLEDLASRDAGERFGACLQ